MKKLNNYDNTTRNMHRNVFKNMDIRHHYDKHDLDNPEGSTVIRGGCGPGKNTYLYTVSGKKKGLNRFESPKDEISANPALLERNRSGSKLSHKEGQAKVMKEWNHYNSNMNSFLVE